MIATALAFLKANKLAAGLGGAMLFAAIVAGAYFKGRGDGADKVRAQYAAMALETAKQARVASEQATTNKDQRDGDFAQEQKEISDAVQDSIDNGGDPVAVYFDQLRASQSRSGETAR